MDLNIPKIIAIIQARMGSTRLPGKTLKLMNGRPMLLYLIENSKKSKFIEDFIVATTINSEDDKIEKFCRINNIKCFRGDEYNVLSRFKIIADLNKPDLILRLTGDNPFIERSFLDYMIKEYLNNFSDYDYINNIHNSYPHGLYVEIFKTAVLDLLEKKSSYEDLEHVTMYLRRNLNSFKTAVIKTKKKFLYKRLTVDNEKDFIFAENLMKELKLKKKIFTFKDFFQK